MRHVVIITHYSGIRNLAGLDIIIVMEKNGLN